MMIALLAIILFIVFQWLKSYTNHGQKIELPSYVGQMYNEAQDEAKDKTFEIIINDSLHIVGKRGGEILTQKPQAGSLVKENRKIYVDVSKYNADEYSLDKDFPTMYGQEYNRTKEILSNRQIDAEIRSEKADKGEPNHILEVWYNGQLVDGPNGKRSGVKISKGAKMQFVVSKSVGAAISIPELRCKTLARVQTILRFNKLKLGTIEPQGLVTNRDSAYVVQQFPAPDPLSNIETGQSIDIVIQQEKPADCK